MDIKPIKTASSLKAVYLLEKMWYANWEIPMVKLYLSLLLYLSPSLSLSRTLILMKSNA